MTLLRVPTFMRNTSSILLLCCTICLTCGVLCILFTHRLADNRNPRACAYYVLTALCFLCTLVLLLARSLRFWQRHLGLNQACYEFCLYASMAFCCLTAGGVALSLGIAPYTAAAFFALLAFCCHACNGFVSYVISRQRDAATQTDHLPEFDV